MAGERGQHVFVSYVQEDGEQVDALCQVLEAAQIPYWRDRKSLAPGDAWKAKIREAIREGSLVFLGCFSDSSRARHKSYMNEELTIAIEEFRKMPPGRTWLIPVRFDNGEVPDWDLGAGRTLSDLNYVDLFGSGYAPQAAALVTTIGKLMGSSQPSPATALAAVAEAPEVDRGPLLRRLTKEMLLDPLRRIQLDDLIAQEVQRINTAYADTERFPAADLPGDNAAQIAVIVDHATRYWQLIEPFCYSLQVAARWGTPDQLEPWVTGMQTLVNAATQSRNGVAALLEIRHLAPVAAITVAALACTASRRWDNARVLLVDPVARDRMGGGKAVPILEATSPWYPFQHAELVASILARTVLTDDDVAAATEHYTSNRGGKYFTPISEWLHAVLRPVFDEQLPDEEQYATAFDRSEILLGVLGQDLATQQYGENAKWRARSQWFGRSTHRFRFRDDSPVTELREELERHGANWAPLQTGLFGGDTDRAARAIEDYGKDFAEVSRTHH